MHSRSRTFSAEFGGHVRTWRRMRNRSIPALAKALGVSDKTIQRWEAGKLPSKVWLRKIARKLKVRNTLFWSTYRQCCPLA
jgi:DNA-binding XRE family transcriptional regulator